MYTTLTKLHATGAPKYCKRGWTAVCNHIGSDYDKPISIHQLIDAVGVQGAIWCLRGFDCDKELFNMWMDEPHTEDEIRLKLIEVFSASNTIRIAEQTPTEPRQENKQQDA